MSKEHGQDPALFAALVAYAKGLSDFEELQAAVDEEMAEDVEAIRAVRRQADALQARADDMQLELEANYPEQFEELREASSDVRRLEADVKNAGHNLPGELAARGTKISHAGVTVTVAKTSFAPTEYSSEPMLRALPELLDMEVEGRPAVARKVNPAIIERLVADGRLKASEVEPYKLPELKVRNPSVRIKRPTGE